MPFKSEAQRNKFYTLVKEGKMSQETLDKWESETPKDKPLPKRIHKKQITSLDALKERIKEMSKYGQEN